MREIVRELYRFRPLVRALVVRHLAVRYRGSFLGFLWSFLNPLFLMLVYVLVFRYYIRFQDVDHYTLFLFVGLLPWLWSSSALLEGTTVISSSGHLVTKSMFPAHVLPAVSVMTTGVHFLLSLVLLVLYMILTGAPFHPTFALLPFLIALQGLLLYGLVLFFSSLNVRFRDVQHVLGNALTLIFFLSPILYPQDRVPEAFQFSLQINPFALFTIAYHNIILDGQLPQLSTVVGICWYVIAVLLLGKMVYTHHHERFAELL